MLVIFAVSLVALLLFIGLAVDAGSLYLTYDQLKRAVDAAAVSAANDFKRNVSVTEMTNGAEEVLQMHNVDLDMTTLQVYTCDTTIFPNLQSQAPSFYALCPTSSEDKRKLVYVQATTHAPLYFLSLLGIPPVTLTTDSTSEAAPIDLVIVLDTSNSMGIGSPGYVANDYNPGMGQPNPNPNGCNLTNTCYPLRYAKDAAKKLIDNGLYQNYDRVAVVTFSQAAKIVTRDPNTQAALTYDLGQNGTGDANSAETQVDSGVLLHYDPPWSRMWSNWTGVSVQGHTYLAFNPVNPEDRDGDGSDTDATAFTMANGSFPVCPGGNDPNPPSDWNNPTPANKYALCCFPNLPMNAAQNLYPHWDYRSVVDVYGWGGVPCDAEGVNSKGTPNYDSYNLSVDTAGQGPYDWDNDTADANSWVNQHPVYNESNVQITNETLSPLSTCSGCGMRVASDILQGEGRPNAVWIIVFLSDGGVNMSDTPKTDPAMFPGALTSAYPNGFCSGALGTDGTMHMDASNNTAPQGFWYDGCTDKDILNRYCINAPDASLNSTCGPQSYSTGTKTYYIHFDPNENNGKNVANWAYSPLDYAMDMVDQAALTVVKNPTSDSSKDSYYNPHELPGNDIAIYSIGVGNALGATGEAFLRYMAAVGDDGDRVTDPCDSTPANTDCGNYYWTNGAASDLNKIFEDIASRIYTRITG